MKQNAKKILALLLALVMCLEPVGNVAAAKMTGREQDDVMSDAGRLEMSGNDSVGHLLAETLSEEQGRQEALAESGDYITELEVSGNQASVDFCTTTNAEVIVAIYEEKTGRMIGSGKTVVGMQDFSADMSIDTGSNTMPQYFIATAYLLDVETHYPLCEKLTVDLYTENMQKLLASTVNDYPDNPVVNLDDNLSTNFAVGNKDMLALNEDTEPYQIMDNGDGTYTVKNADDKITGLHAGDTLSYEYADGSILLIKVSDIAFDGNTVIITEEKDVDLTDFFDYIKIEADSYGCEMKLEEVPGSDIDAQMETGSLDQHKIRAWEDEGSFSQSFSVPISKKWKGVTLRGSANLGFTATIKYYLSLNYQYVSTKIEYSLGGSVDISGKLEMLEIPLMRVELPILPCVNVGFTPSFVVQASGKIALSVELKGTLGVEYDSNNGMKNLCKAPSTSSKLEITGTIFIGIKATPYVGIINADLAKVKLDMTAGIEAKAKKRLLSSSSDDKHECKLCFDGTLSTKLSATAGMNLIKDLVKLEAKIAEINLENGNFYYSIDYGEFGWSTCPHIKYKATINAIDVKGNTVAGAKLVIKNKYTNANVPIETPDGKNENAVTDDSGKIDVYLGNGSYIIEAATDDMSGTKNFTVHDRKTSGKITLIEDFNSDITTDPDKCSVEVKAVDESGKPVAGAVVSCAKLDKTYKTDLKGIVTLKLTAGTYDLLFKTDTLTGYVQINVENENVSETVIMKSAAHGVIHLTVIDEYGNPISDVQILGTELPDTPQTDKNGKAIFELEVGKQYSLSVKKGGLFGSYSFTVQEGEQNVQIDMKMETFSWELNDGVLKINGNGKMPNYSSDNLPEWCGEAVKKVFIMDGITSIGNYAFYGCSNLADVVVSKEVWIIGDSAFKDCSNLASIDLPDGLKSIGYNAFDDCDSLIGLELPASTSSINPYAFIDCDNLTKIKFSDSLQTIGIGWDAFRGCNKLENIEFSASSVSIGARAFAFCPNLKSIKLPNGSSLGIETFQGCSSLTSVELPNDLKLIPNRTFHSCRSLVSINLPESLESIDSESFDSCSNLVKIELPTSLTLIGNNAFENCNKLVSIKQLPAGLKTIGNCAFSGCSSLSGIIKLPENITSIGYKTFYGCNSLERVELPVGLKSISWSAFSNCGNLTSIELPDGLTSIGDSAFSGCSSLASSIKLPSGLTSIEDGVFSGCSSLTEVKLPSSMTSIGNAAFSGCSSLVGIDLPLSITSIGKSAFKGCSGLTEIEIPAGVSLIEDRIFTECSNLVRIKIPLSITSIGTGAFKDCSNLVNMKLPATLTSIGDEAFRSCENLVSIELPSGVTSIGNNTFAFCSSLTDVGMPSGLKSIGNYAFSHCSNISKIEFPSSLTAIDSYAFEDCSSLERIEWPENIASMSSHVFGGCSSLVEIKLPLTLKTIDVGALWGCSSLSDIELPSSLTSIGEAAFAYCRNLKNIELPLGLTSIGDRAFAGNEKISIYFKGDRPLMNQSVFVHAYYATAYYPQNNSTWNGIENEDWNITWKAYKRDNSTNDKPGVAKISMKKRSVGMKTYLSMAKETPAFLSAVTKEKSGNYSGLMPKAFYIHVVVIDEKAEDLFAAKNLLYIEQETANDIGQVQFSNNDEIVNGTSIIYGPSNKSLANAEVTVGKITADGTVQYPDVSVAYNGIELEENTDFKLSGDTRIIDAGTYSLTVKGINDYAGSKTVSYTTSNADIKPDINISVKIAGATNLKNGSTVQLTAEISPDNAKIKSLSWSSDNPSVATVDQNGLVAAKGAGKAKITVTCTSEDGKMVSASCVISVEKSSEDSDDTSSEVNDPEKPNDTANNGSGGAPSGNGSNNGNSGSSGSSSSSGNLPSDDNISNDNISGDNDNQLIAKLAYYIVWFDANLGIKLSRKTMTLLNDDNLGILPKVQRKNYIFNGWYTQKTGGSKVSSSTVLNAGTTLYAQWTKVNKPYKVKAPILKSNKSGQLDVSFQKIKGAKGYEISYSVNKKFPSSSVKKAVSSSAKKILKKLKSGKKYYVRVRAYKLDSTGKKVYGSYSAVKSIKVK